MAAIRSSDLEALAARHAEDEAEEATRDLVDARRPLSVRRPPGGKLVHSEAWLTRLYRGGRIVREKKPAVFDHLRSIGPWFVSVDERALSVLDAMSQTATLPAGFSPDAVVRGYVDGAFGDALTAGGEGLPGHPAV